MSKEEQRSMIEDPTLLKAPGDGGRRELRELRLPELKRGVANHAEKLLDEIVDLLSAERSVINNTAANWGVIEPSGHVAPDEPIELSIVMPCLDEADTVGKCVLKAIHALEQMRINGEVIVADNGSRDDSVEIAESLGARVVHVDEPGYGAALMGGIEAARGKFVLMGDADDSYDFSQAHKFYARLEDGADLVQGCRLPRGGGRIMPGAMPWLHQLGNPLLTWLVQRMFGAKIQDVYCGMRAFRKEWYAGLDQRCTGMEFATEMIIKSTLFGADIREVPITLHPDGRQSHRPHLRTFRDGWRTLRFFLLLSPRWTFLVPGGLAASAGIVGCCLVLMHVSLAGVVFDAHTLLVSMLALLLAAQLGSFSLLAKNFAATERLLPRDPRVEKISELLTLERCLWAAGTLVASGLTVIGWKSWSWANSGFGELDYSETMRWIIPAAGAVALGAQLAFSSFMLGVLRMERRSQVTPGK